MSQSSFETSEHKAIYERVASEHNTAPEHVYELAHGLHASNHEDNEILNALEKSGIITVTRHKVRKRKSESRARRRRKKILGYLKIVFNIIYVLAFLALVYYLKKNQ